MQKNKRTQSKSPSIPNPAQETKRGQPPHLLVTVKGETYRIAPVRLRQYAVHRAAGGTRDITEFKAEPVEQTELFFRRRVA